MKSARLLTWMPKRNPSFMLSRLMASSKSRLSSSSMQKAVTGFTAGFGRSRGSFNSSLRNTMGTPESKRGGSDSASVSPKASRREAGLMFPAFFSVLDRSSIRSFCNSYLRSCKSVALRPGSTQELGCFATSSTSSKYSRLASCFSFSCRYPASLSGER